MESPLREDEKLVRAAAVQARPVWFKLEATVDKTCCIVAQAAKSGAQIVAFPECWLPGYPTWIWSRPLDLDMTMNYMQNSIVLDSSEMQRIRKSALDHKIVVCLGYSERRQGSLYVGQCVIDSNGEVLVERRKLKPFHMERTIFGDGDGVSLANVAMTSAGRIGSLSCGEHFNPLVCFSTYSQDEQIHVAAWPPVKAYDGGLLPYSMSSEAVACLSRTYSLQAQCFTLHSTAVMTEDDIKLFGTQDAPIFSSPGGGNAKIFGPDGRQLTEDLPATEEGIVYADLDLALICKEKAMLDTCGHCSKPELLSLSRNTNLQPIVWSGPHPSA